MDNNWNSADGKGKDWMMTFTGRQVFPLAVKPEDVCIEDIAHATAMQCRYNGHVNRFYSVAEHMLHISAALFQDTGDRVLALQGLLHDANETYTGDMIRPVKNSLKAALANWKQIEDGNERAIMAALNVPYPLDPRVKEYDYRIIVDEKEALFGPAKPWGWDHKALDVVIRGYMPDEAKHLYLQQYHKLRADWGAYQRGFSGTSY